LGAVVEALQALRGVALISAVTFMAEIGDVRRFENPRKLMAYLGLVPSEYSTGQTVKCGGITKAGNSRVRNPGFGAHSSQGLGRIAFRHGLGKRNFMFCKSYRLRFRTLLGRRNQD
jgi:transposase